MWVNITPFDRPVVPEVYTIEAICSLSSWGNEILELGLEFNKAEKLIILLEEFSLSITIACCLWLINGVKLGNNFLEVKINLLSESSNRNFKSLWDDCRSIGTLFPRKWERREEVRVMCKMGEYLWV